MNKPAAPGHGRPGRDVPWPGGQVELTSGRSLFVRHADAPDESSTPIVLIHGLGGSAQNWAGLMDELYGVAEQWAPDLPGFGESMPARQHNVDEYASVVIEFVENLSRPAHIIANSMGGLITVLAAARRPDLVSSLSLVSPAMPNLRLPPVARGMALLAVPRVGERLLAKVNSMPPDEQVRRLATVMFGDPDMADKDGYDLAVEERARRMEQGHADAVLLESLRSIVGHYVRPPWRSDWKLVRSLSCPTLVILGGKDTLVGSSSAARWRRALPDATVVTFPETGHVAMMERPAVVAELIREHIGR